MHFHRTFEVKEPDGMSLVPFSFRGRLRHGRELSELI